MEADAVEAEMGQGVAMGGVANTYIPAAQVAGGQKEEVKQGGMTEEEKELEALMM